MALGVGLGYGPISKEYKNGREHADFCSYFT